MGLRTWHGGKVILRFLFLAAIFALAYAQSPLFSGNQNQYFLHGIAKAGVGLLADDWLANTVDPTPVFTLLVRETVLHLPQWVFYVYYGALQGAYLVGLLGIVSVTFGIKPGDARFLPYLALLVGLHSALFNSMSSLLVGFGVGSELVAGLAFQSALGPVFQPSTFAALLVLSLSLFLRGAKRLAVLSTAAASVVHPTYLLSGVVLTVAFIVAEMRWGGQLKSNLPPGVFGIAAMLPMLVYAMVSFYPTSSQAWNEAQEILVHFRLPHHAVVARWLQASAYLKVGLAIAATVLVRRTKLFDVLLVSGIVATAATLVQVVSGSKPLALAFPWRVSVYLVPVSVAVLLAWAVSRVIDWRGLKLEPARGVISALSLMVLGGVALGGIVHMTREFKAAEAGDAVAVMRFVAKAKTRGDVFLVPPFLEEFRLSTGAPVLVDWKSIPYKDVEVLEWHKRFVLVNRVYEGARERLDCRLISKVIQEYRITYVVVKYPSHGESCDILRSVYDDGAYSVYAVTARG